MPFDIDKLIVAYSSKNIGTFNKELHKQNEVHVISPVSIFISIEVPKEHYDKFSIFEVMKEAVALLLYEKVIASSSQIKELAVEKKRGANSEICVFLQGD